jgi:hypothetical protein
MQVVNIHQRLLPASPERVGKFIDLVASRGDTPGPHDWPPMRLDRPLGVGAKGGHGPIRYVVQAYTPGQSVRFRFTEPKGFIGWHGLEILEATPAHCVLEHRIEMRTEGLARLSWPIIIRPLHDALIEDGLSRAQAALGLEPRIVRWSPWVRFLRWARGVGTVRVQSAPSGTMPS